MSCKHFCDICGNEMPERLNKTLDKIEKLFEVADIDDCCKECLNIIENSPIDDIIKSKMQELCCPKSKDEEKRQYFYWLHHQPWIVQQDIYNHLTQILRVEPKEK